ncbi:hypothetical protein D3C72_1499640 [compost metagenome]
MAQVDQHRRHHRGFDHAEHEADDDQPVSVGDNPGQRREATPEDQADENQLLHAVFLRVNRPRHLEEKVTEEEQRTEHRRQARRDHQVGGHPGGGGKTVVGAIEVRQAVGDEHDGHDVPPAAGGERCGFHG